MQRLLAQSPNRIEIISQSILYKMSYTICMELFNPATIIPVQTPSWGGVNYRKVKINKIYFRSLYDPPESGLKIITFVLSDSGQKFNNKQYYDGQSLVQVGSSLPQNYLKAIPCGGANSVVNYVNESDYWDNDQLNSEIITSDLTIYIYLNGTTVLFDEISLTNKMFIEMTFE